MNHYRKAIFCVGLVGVKFVIKFDVISSYPSVWASQGDRRPPPRLSIRLYSKLKVWIDVTSIGDFSSRIASLYLNIDTTSRPPWPNLKNKDWLFSSSLSPHRNIGKRPWFMKDSRIVSECFFGISSTTADLSESVLNYVGYIQLVWQILQKNWRMRARMLRRNWRLKKIMRKASLALKTSTKLR